MMKGGMLIPCEELQVLRERNARILVCCEAILKEAKEFEKLIDSYEDDLYHSLLYCNSTIKNREVEHLLSKYVPEACPEIIVKFSA